MEHTEIRDGKVFTVTVLPAGAINPRRSKKTRYHYKDVGKPGSDEPKEEALQSKTVAPENTKFPFVAYINGKPRTIRGPRG